MTTPKSDSLPVAMEAAQQADEPRFHLAIDCTDDHGARKLELFPSGVGTWAGTSQFETSADTRRTLISILLEAGFAEFDALYGQRETHEKAKGPLRISCLVALRLGEFSKNVAQVADGKRFEPFVMLATRLLDELEPLGRSGTTASSLSDGLKGVAEGRFAPELLSMRLVLLPAKGNEAAGRIIRVEGGLVSHQAYTPGSFISPAEESLLNPQIAAKTALAIRESGFSTWPINLPGLGMTELHVEVLGNGHSVTARAYSRIPAGERVAEGQAMTELVADLIEVLQPASNKQGTEP